MVEFANPWALYGLAVLIPVIILYMLKPKPRDLKVPSLMFLVEMDQRRRLHALFKRVLHDPLLLMQLAALALIALAMAEPFYTSIVDRPVQRDVAIVLDVSASMGAGSPSRFESARGHASAILASLGPGDRATIILAEKVPMVALRQGDAGRAQAVIDRATVKATPTGLGGAILLAADILQGSQAEKEVYALSDFSRYEGLDPLAAQREAVSKGSRVEMIKVGSPEDNVAIISLRAGRDSGCYMEFTVKNYGQARDVEAVMTIDGAQSASGKKQVGAGDSEPFMLSGACSGSGHDLVASISPGGALAADDRAYAIIPEETAIRALLIRERGGGEQIKFALESAGGVSVEEAVPPVYPQDYGYYDVVVFQEALPQNILAGTFPELAQFVGAGGNLILIGSANLMKVPQSMFAGLLPVELIEALDVGGSPRLSFTHPILDDVDLEDVRFIRHLQVEALEGTVTLATILDSPLIALGGYGAGRVAYVGVPADASASDFHLKPSFPIFWHNLLYWLNQERVAAEGANVPTGDKLPLATNASVRVEKPSGDVMEGRDVLLDEAGFYRIGSIMRAAASLLDAGESDLSYSIEPGPGGFNAGYEGGRVTEEVTTELFPAFAAAALMLIAFEWYYCRRRGSI